MSSDPSYHPERLLKSFLRPRFRLGRCMTTPGALEALNQSGDAVTSFLGRHASGDWGSVDAHDARANDEAIRDECDPDRQSRVLSSYRTRLGERLWVITEADRSATTILLPSEY